VPELPRPDELSRPEIQGHRGVRALRPENTLPGLARALAIGVDALEFDVTLTADGGLILAHDLTVNATTIRGPHAGTPWRELTLPQVAALEAGWRTPPDPFGDTFEPAPGTAVPTLDQVCRLVLEAGADHVTLAVELKTSPSWPTADIEAISRAALDTLAAHGLTGRARVLAFNWRVLQAARDQAPAVPRVALVEPSTWVPGSPWLAGLDPADFGADESGFSAAIGCAPAAQTVAAAWLSPRDYLVSQDLIQAAHGCGLKVVSWTVNDGARMGELIGQGIDAIITDRPDVLRRVVAARGGALPEAIRLPWRSGLPAWAPAVPVT